MSASQPPASEQYESWKRHPNVYSEPTHRQWLAEVTSLRAALAAAQGELKKHCACRFTSGGHLKKPCEFHKRISDVASREALERAATICEDAYMRFGHAADVTVCAKDIRAMDDLQPLPTPPEAA